MPQYFKILTKKLSSVINILIFLPFYFNVTTHLRHLFSPWKQLVGERKEPGFAISDYLNELSMNLVSRFIGATMRLIVLTIFIVCYGLSLFVLVPLWFLLAFMTTPVSYVWQQIFWPEKVKEKAKQVFLSTHLFDRANQPAVEAWFESSWQLQKEQEEALSLRNLLQIAPIGRSWHYGFTPTLDNYSQDLTSSLTYKNILLDREEEIRDIERALSKTQDANAILVGAEGVGKHTIVGGLAQNINSGKTVPGLQNQRIVELNVEQILSQKSSYEEKVSFLEELLTEATMAKNLIIVISDFHKYITGNLVGDFSSVWSKFAKRPLIRLLVITTPFYYEQIIYHNDKLKSLFNKVKVAEPSRDKALEILLAKALLFEKHYALHITYEAVVQVIERSEYYVTHIPFPEKAITLLDEVCVYVEAMAQKGKQTGSGLRVNPEHVDYVLQKKTQLPVGKLGPHLKDKLLHLEKLLANKIYGQNKALSEIGKAVRRSYIEERRKKPLISLLFMGPTGVGKTETAKELACIFFNNPDNLLRFDMSFYQNKQNLSDLIGSYEKQSPGLLANSIREKPHSVLLIDEIEKADKDILSVFLTLLDEGYLIDGFGERVDCKNLIVVATSNAASKEILGWVNDYRTHLVLETLVRDFVIEKGIFSPEFLNRFDKVLVFEPLGLKIAYEIGYKIAREVLDEYQKQRGLEIKVLPKELYQWIQDAYKAESGVREIDRTIRENLADKASLDIL